jgi:L-alanine-DL-glutamate epimerase-like enolase superfamily enzyme
VPRIVEFFAPVLIGQNVDDIPELQRRMYHCGNFWCRVGVGATVLGGIEAALWDLKGKLEGVPAYELLGGRKHDRLQAYATGGPSNYPEEKLARKIDYYCSLGFTAFKVATGRFTNAGVAVDQEPEQAAAFEASKLEFIRSHAGKDIGVMLDSHMGNSHSAQWSLDTALAVAKALESYGLIFLEEPLHYTDLEGYAQLWPATETTIAGGECLTASCEWQSFVEKDCFDIGQPDASFLAGLSDFMHVARDARTSRPCTRHALLGRGGIVNAEHSLRICGGEHQNS